MNKLYKLQSLILFAGTIFAWITIYNDFSRFYKFYGSFTRLQDCAVPNPVTTPCFYGAFAFLFGFIWSLFILKRKSENRRVQQRKLNILLIASTIFAWGNFILEVIRFYTIKNGPKVSCSGISTDNVLLTPCFYGSVIFLTALIISVIIIIKSKPKV